MPTSCPTSPFFCKASRLTPRHNRPIMNPRTVLGRAAIAAALSTLLVSCSLLGDAWTTIRRDAPAAEKRAAASTLPGPVATHRFEIDPQRDDVVGIVQLTVAGEEDTLPDIARRFNVGYEEIVRANPGVDPWLPGAGREIVVPSRFVLPDTPREGVVINVAAMRIFYY